MSVGRKLLLSVIALMVGVAALESAASAVLFRFYAHKGTGFFPYGTASGFLFKKVFQLLPRPSFALDNPDMFKADSVLGYKFNPGVYHIVEKSGDGGLHAFKVTIQNDGYRATSALTNVGARRIYLMGNSTIWGFGLDDEMSIPWMLQTHVNEFRVQNFAVTGYTMVQSLLQLRAIESQLTQDDIVVFPYSDYDQHYNVGDTPGPFGHGFEQTLSKIPDFDKLQLPFGYLSRTGELGIRYLPIDCATHLATCSAGPGEIIDGQKVTEAIFEEILKRHRSHIVVAFGQGGDDDPIITHLQSEGVPVADFRFPKSPVDANDYLPGHDHVGAFANYAKFAELLQTLQKSGLVPAHLTEQQSLGVAVQTEGSPTRIR